MDKEVKTSFQQLEEMMEIAPAPVLKVVENVSNAVVEAHKEESNKPNALADEAREVYRRALNKMEDLADEMTEIARGSERGRDFEIAGGLVTQMVAIAEKIKNSAFIEQEVETPVSNVTNQTQQNIYVGSSEELMRLIRTGGNKSDNN